MRQKFRVAMGFTLPFVLLTGCAAAPGGSAALQANSGSAALQANSGKAAGARPYSNDPAPKGFKRRTAKGVINDLRGAGFLTGGCEGDPNQIRLLPPLTLDTDEADTFVSAMQAILP